MQIRILLAIAAVLTIGLTATAKATIPNSQTGVYTGCYLPNQGNVLRLIDFQLTGGNDCEASRRLELGRAEGRDRRAGPGRPQGRHRAAGPRRPVVRPRPLPHG